MRRKSVLAVLIGVLLVGLVLAAVIKRRGAGDTVKLGSILVLSGDYKSLGEQVRDGQQLAVDEVNAEPGRKKKLEIVFLDSQGEKAMALEKVKVLQRDGVKVISEIFGSPSASHSIPYIKQEQMLFVSGVDTGASLTKEGGENFFRIIPSDKLACQQLSARALDMGLKRAAIVYVNDEWGNGLRTEFEPEYKRLGGEIVSSVETGKGQDLFQPVVANIKSRQPQVILLFIYPREAALLVKEARLQQVASAFMGTDNLTGSEVSEVGGDSIQGVMYVVPQPPKTTEQFEHFKQLYSQKVGAAKEPPLFASQGYDVIHLLARAIEESNGDLTRVRQILENIKYTGATGPIAFGPDHELIVSDYQLKIYRKLGGRMVADNYQPESQRK
jgi:branched-chain amino acid transport system substrate-binding protein